VPKVAVAVAAWIAWLAAFASRSVVHRRDWPILAWELFLAEDRIMSLFYLLPRRAVLGDHLADALAVLLPGLDLDVAERSRLAEVVLEALEGSVPGFVVSREDLPAGEAAEQALIDGFGATAGDEVVEVRPAARPGEFSSRRWRIRCCAAGNLS
jgi:hypothetical protein